MMLRLFGIARPWERHVIFRLGRLSRITGPGFYWMIPFVDQRHVSVDTRIITFVVPLQRGLTRDNIPVDVDAIAFYRVADERAATLEVDSYHRATQLSIRSAVREMVGKSTLDELLSERDKIGDVVQRHVAQFGRRWGVDVVAVEIKDVIVSKELEDAIAREPAAEREKRARVKLSEAEKLTARTIVDAAAVYRDQPVALALRSMNMLYEMCMEGKSTMVFIPTEKTGAGMPSMIGMESIEELLQRAADKSGNGRPPEAGASGGDRPA